jgi:quercetin dioxygenase-like cupin family protein
MDKARFTDESLLAKAVDLTGLVDYQSNAVVSRTIIDRKTGTVTLFAFDKGQGLSEHSAPFDALVYIVDGEAGVTISGEEIPLKTGEVTVMPAHRPHALKAVDRFKMVLVMIRDA